MTLTKRGKVVVAVLVAATIALAVHAIDRATMSPECRKHMTDWCLTDQYGGHAYHGLRVTMKQAFIALLLAGYITAGMLWWQLRKHRR